MLLHYFTEFGYNATLRIVLNCPTGSRSNGVILGEGMGLAQPEQHEGIDLEQVFTTDDLVKSDDVAFAEGAFKAAAEIGFRGPLALLKDPPRAGSAVPDRERVQREIEAGVTPRMRATRPGDSPC